MEMKWLIGEVAKRHGIVLGKDDPVLVTLTFHEVVMREYVEQVVSAVEEATAEMAAASAQQVEYARRAAKELLGGAAAGAGEEVRLAGERVRARLADAAEEQVRDLRREVMAARRERWLALGCAVVAVGGALATLVLR